MFGYRKNVAVLLKNLIHDQRNKPQILFRDTNKRLTSKVAHNYEYL